jgi:ubiquinone/menaquinone biosynthesis C-methylase UbiE
MITRSDDYVEYCRETARHLRHPQDLALRGKNKEALTRRVQERIVREVALGAADDLIDIGCGDGTLLLLAKRAGVHSATGLHPTEEEAAIVRRLGLQVRQGFTDQIPLVDESASVVVCNNVLLIVPREKIPASLREIYRVAKPGARILIGEIPFEPGPPPEPEFATAHETLAYLYRRYGLRTCLGMLRRMIYWKLSGQPMTIRTGSQVSFYAQPQEFIALAQAIGLELVRSWQHEDPSNRYNYLFRKAEAPAASTANDAAKDSDSAA